MERIKKLIRECPVTSGIYLKLAQSYKAKQLEKDRDHYQKNSLRILSSVQDTLTSYRKNSKFFFMFGTALGAYRDKKLIRNDMDIDVGIYINTDEESITAFRNHMEKNDFKLIHYYSVDQIGLIQDSFTKDGIKVDVAYLRHTEANDCCYLIYDTEEEEGKVLIFPFTCVFATQVYIFNDITINLPEDADQYLKDTYGPDWRIPNPDYKYWENPSAKKTDLHGTITICNE